MPDVTVTVVTGVEGRSLYVNDYRVLGPKPWGGGAILQEWEVDRDVLLDDLKKAGVV
jgi:hypothetical protein